MTIINHTPTFNLSCAHNNVLTVYIYAWESVVLIKVGENKEQEEEEDVDEETRRRRGRLMKTHWVYPPFVSLISLGFQTKYNFHAVGSSIWYMTYLKAISQPLTNLWSKHPHVHSTYVFTLPSIRISQPTTCTCKMKYVTLFLIRKLNMLYWHF